MYLVEIEPGREMLYQSVSALGEATHGGQVGPQSRIFHRTSSSWVSITVHPEYKKAVTARASEPLPPLARNRWTFFGLESNGREVNEPPATMSKADPAPAENGKRPGGLKGLLGRAFRNRSPVPSTSERAST
jgi:hypothetical protein